jgi:hypothetical protein
LRAPSRAARTHHEEEQVPGRRQGLPVLFVPGILALALVAIPAWLIQPFRPQSPRDLAIAFLLRAWSPLLTLVLAGAALLGALWLWPGNPGFRRRAALVLAVLLPGFAAWAARQNHFESMFHPLPRPRFVAAAQAEFLAASDRVLGVALHGEAAAYPVRQLAYHHLVHDRVGGIDLVVTY